MERDCQACGYNDGANRGFRVFLRNKDTELPTHYKRWRLYMVECYLCKGASRKFSIDEVKPHLVFGAGDCEMVGVLTR